MCNGVGFGGKAKYSDIYVTKCVFESMKHNYFAASDIELLDAIPL